MILLNAIDDLSSYIQLFKKGEYTKFPAASNVVVESKTSNEKEEKVQTK